MNSKLTIMENKYKNLTSNAEGIENEYFQSVISSFSYKKIGKGAMYNIRPFEIQRAGFKVGRELKALPKAIKNTHVYYFDDSDNVLLIESYGQAENIINKEYFFYANGHVESVYFNSGTKSIRNINCSKLESGRVIETLNYGKVGSSISTYIYQDDILTEIHIKQKEHDKEDVVHYNVYFEYKEGILDKITDRHPNGYEEQRYP